MRIVVLTAALVACGSGMVAAQTTIDECGELVAGVECALFETADGSRFVLSERGKFDVGDRVHVIGVADPQCASICMEGEGCIEVANITYCDGDFAACGELVDGVTCVLFEDDRGFLFAIDETGEFSVGDRVRVTGTFERECISICQQTTGCVRDNAIRAVAEGSCEEDDDIVCSGVSFGFFAMSIAGLIWFKGRGRR